MVDSDLPVYRETVERGSIIIRMAQSFIRFGNFEYFHHTNQHDLVKKLADYVIDKFYPELLNSPCKYQSFFKITVIKTAELIAHWQSVGFAHGVMNTDNMSILGDTIDYGPFGFLDIYDPDFICNHSDYNGRYAFKMQPGIGLWNCNALAHALSSLISIDDLKVALQEYEPAFASRMNTLMGKKLGLEKVTDSDGQLINNLLQAMSENHVDYTLFFRRLCDFHPNQDNKKLAVLFQKPQHFQTWAKDYCLRLQQQELSCEQRQKQMRQTNPKYILRNYMAEIAIRKAEDEKDYSEINNLLKILENPYLEHPEAEEYAGLPPTWSCGISVSCSS